MTQFFVNRGVGRAPEGPFEEQQIVRLILAGKLSTALVCPAGGQRFTPLSSHPPFARALEAAGHAPAPAAQFTRLSSPKKTSRGLLIGAVLSIFGLALGAVAIGSYVVFSNGGMPARGATPVDSELFFELKSVPQMLADLRMVRVLDADQTVAKKLLDDSATTLSESLGISKAQADTVLLGASSLGIAARKLATTPEGGVLLTFNNAVPVNALLSSERFTYTGLVSTNGRRYKLSGAEPVNGKGFDITRRTLAALSIDSPAAVLVWFETSKVLFVGSPSFAESVARVISLDAPSLERSPGFRDAQRDFADKPNAIGYFDVTKLGAVNQPRVQAVLDGYLKGSGPITANFKLVPAGLLTRLVGRASGAWAGSQIPLARAQPLTVIDRLPVETFAYAAAVTQTDLPGAELQKRLLAQISSGDPRLAEQVGVELEQAEQRLHVHLEQILGSLGDQGALAVLAPPNYSLMLAQPQQMLANFAVVYAQGLRDEAPLRGLLKQELAESAALATRFEIQEDRDGYRLTPKENELGLNAQFRFSNGYLYVAFGGTALVERSLRALLAGENTLAADPAQRAARAALPSAVQFVAWVDAGRVVDTLQRNPLLAGQANNFNLSAVHWTGPDRVTAALAITGELRDGVYTYRVDTLNLPVFAGISGLGWP